MSQPAALRAAPLAGSSSTSTRSVPPSAGESSNRNVSLAKLLREHKLASHFSGDADPVFATATGTAGNRHNISRRVPRPAAARAKVEGLRLHDLRHCYASMLIAGGASVVFVAGQMGHASPAMTLSTYSHLFDQRDHADALASAMESSFGNIVETASRGEARSGAVAVMPESAPLRAVAG